MANTKTLTGSGIRGYSIEFYCNETGTDIASNTSTISYSLKIKSGNYSYSQYGTGWSIYINGTRVSYMADNGIDTSISANSSLTLATGTTTVTHNNDGTKTVNLSASVSMPEGSYGPGDMSCSGTWTLTTIPRASTLSVPSLTIGSASTLTVTAASSAFTHQISYSFSGLTGTVATLAAGVSTASWTPPNTFYAKLPNSTSGTVVLTLKTYSNSVEIGSNSYNATVSVPSSIKPTAPTVTLAPVNTNAWISSKGIYVGGYSAVKVTSSATAGSGATISSYTISGAFSGSGTPYTSAVLSAGSKSITVTATDSRGRTNSTTTSVTFLTYTYPGLTTFAAVRGTYSGGSWTTDVNGNHIRVQAVPSVALSANGNTASVTVKIGNTNPDATSGNYYYFTGTNATTSYVITGSVTDSVGNSTSRSLTVPTIEVPFNVDVDLPGIGVGMIAQTAHQFEVAPAWSFVADGKHNKFLQMPYSAIVRGTAGTVGYARIASIQAIGTWAYGSIIFDVRRLYDSLPARLSLYFETGSGVVPTNVIFRYESYTGTYVNRPFEAYVVQTDSTLDVYVNKCTGNDEIIVTTYFSANQEYHATVTYPDGQISTIPSGAKKASPAYALSYTPTFTKTSGPSTAYSPTLLRYGSLCLVTFYLVNGNSQTDMGTNAWVGSTNLPTPIAGVSSATYSGQACLIAYLQTNGGMVVRVTGAAWPATYDTARFSLVYFTADA